MSTEEEPRIWHQDEAVVVRVEPRLPSELMASAVAEAERFLDSLSTGDAAMSRESLLAALRDERAARVAAELERDELRAEVAALRAGKGAARTTARDDHNAPEWDYRTDGFSYWP